MGLFEFEFFGKRFFNPNLVLRCGLLTLIGRYSVGSVLYTYTKRFACFCWVSVLMTRRVFAESVFATYFDRSFIVVVDRQFIDVSIDRGACTVAEGPRDAESWFRAETYYIRILNVSPVFAESVFLMTRRVFAESVFVESGFADEARYCWVSY